MGFVHKLKMSLIAYAVSVASDQQSLIQKQTVCYIEDDGHFDKLMDSVALGHNARMCRQI